MTGARYRDGLSSASPMEPQASPPKASIPSADSLRAWVAERCELLRAEIGGLALELREIEAVAKALKMPSPPDHRTYSRSGAGTIQSAAMTALESAPQGLSSADLRPIIESLLGRSFTRESIAPQLSRLKSKGLVRHRGTRWFATARQGDEA